MGKGLCSRLEPVVSQRKKTDKESRKGNLLVLGVFGLGLFEGGLIGGALAVSYNRLELQIHDTEECKPQIVLYKRFSKIYEACGFEEGLAERL